MAEKKKALTAELETLCGELARLKPEKEALGRELESKNATIAQLEQALASRDSEITTLKQTMVESEQKLADINRTLAQAIASYKSLVVAANPEIPPELIIGETIEAVNESLASARTLIDKVKQGIEAETLKLRVPAGAPQRALPDLSVLSPREKIQYAIGGNQ